MYWVYFLYFTGFLMSLFTGILLDATTMTVNRAQVQGGVDTAAMAGATQQKQVVLTNNANGAPLSWKYELDVPRAQVAAQQTWEKNVSQWPKGIYGADIWNMNWIVTSANSINGSVDLSMQPQVEQKVAQQMFQTVPSTVSDTVAPVGAQASTPDTVFP